MAIATFLTPLTVADTPELNSIEFRINLGQLFPAST